MVVSLLTHICVTRPQWAKANFISGYFDGLFLGLYCLPVEYHDHVWQMSLTRLGCRFCTLCYAIFSALKAHRGKTWRILTLEIKKKTCLAKTWRKLANAMPLWSDGQLTIQRILWMTVIRESKNPTTIRKCNHVDCLSSNKKMESVMPTVVNTPWGDKAARVITFSNQHDLSFLGSKLASIALSNFTHIWYLHWCQNTKTCSHVSAIQNSIYKFYTTTCTWMGTGQCPFMYRWWYRIYTSVDDEFVRTLNESSLWPPYVDNYN